MGSERPAVSRQGHGQVREQAGGKQVRPDHHRPRAAGPAGAGLGGSGTPGPMQRPLRLSRLLPPTGEPATALACWLPLWPLWAAQNGGGESKQGHAEEASQPADTWGSPGRESAVGLLTRSGQPLAVPQQPTPPRGLRATWPRPFPSVPEVSLARAARAGCASGPALPPGPPSSLGLGGGGWVGRVYTCLLC